MSETLDRGLTNSAARARRVFVVCNEAAGSVQPGDGARVRAMLAEAGFGDVAELDWPAGKDRLASVARDDLVVVLGGDGTARTVAEAARGNGPILVLLPGGTLNVLPHALYGELAWPEALAAALARGRVRRMSGGLANGKPFFVAAAFGAPTILARAREAARQGQFMRALRRLRHFTLRLFSLRLRARHDDTPPVKAEAIAVLCPSFSGSVERAPLEWVRFDARRLHDILRVGVKALTSAWRGDEAIEVQPCERGDIVSRGFIPAILDGEPQTFHGRVRIQTLRDGPRVLALD